ELPHVCVLFLTARDAVEDRVAGITAGGDDYVTKPFSLEEVLARLRGLLRRAGIARSRSDTELVVGDLTMDGDAREVRRGGELVSQRAGAPAHPVRTRMSRLGDWLAGRTLRWRLITGLVALLALACAVAGFVIYLTLNRALVNQVDAQLTAAGGRYAACMEA